MNPDKSGGFDKEAHKKEMIAEVGQLEKRYQEICKGLKDINLVETKQEVKDWLEEVNKALAYFSEVKGYKYKVEDLLRQGLGGLRKTKRLFVSEPPLTTRYRELKSRLERMQRIQNEGTDSNQYTSFFEGFSSGSKKSEKSYSHYYNILGVDEMATPKEIKRAYRKLALRYHPDRNPDDPSVAGKFREIAEAFKILTEDRK